MEAGSQRGHSGRLPVAECPRSFLDSIPSPIAPAPPGSLGYVITKEHVDEMRRLERLCEADEERIHREYKPIFLPVDDYLSKEINCELINADIRSYPWKTTPFGDVYYSPRYNDDRYTYRHVLLTNGVRKEAERVAATVPGGLLTEEVFVHYLGIVLSSGWSHFMLFNKQFKELILRRPKEPDTPTTGEEATRIRDGAPGPNDEVDSDSGDDADQRAAIARVRSTKATRLHQELGEQRREKQPERTTAASSSLRDGPCSARNLPAPDPLHSQAGVARFIANAQEEKENAAERENTDAPQASTEGTHSFVCGGHLASEREISDDVTCGASLGALKGAAVATQEASERTQGAAPQPITLQPSRRRKAPSSRAAPQGTTASVLQPTGTGESASDATERFRGRVGVRRREPVAAGKATTAARQQQSEHSWQSAHPGTTLAQDPGIPGSVSRRGTARNTAILRPQPKVGARRLPTTTLQNAATRTRGLLEEKAANSGDEPTGKRRLEGRAAAQEKFKARQRRV